MPVVKFLSTRVDSQLYGSEQEHMVAVVSVEVGGVTYDCELRQDDGETRNFDETELNITIPEPLRSMVKYEPFRVAAQNYHRRVAAGGEGGAINLKGKSYIQIEGLTFQGAGRYVVDIPGPNDEE